ncbi:MAG TPA: indole-3-glycerol phosphate synthase TrpC [Herpetosiphonaceae bacterium]
MSEATYLDRILAHKREEVARQHLKVPLAEIQERAQAALPPRSFGAVLRRHRLSLIAEVKQKSPSKGVLAPNFDPIKLAQTYIASGADALSVLTDVRFFGGSLQYLKTIRAMQPDPPEDGRPGSDAEAGAVYVPLLRKDFILEPYQVYEARAYGADALLLIVAALDDGRLRALLDLTEALGMEALVEVHDEHELERALALGASIVGVNNRNLHTFEVSLTTTERLLAALPSTSRPILVSESGIRGSEDCARLRAWGADAILVGEAIVTAPNIAAKIRELTGEAPEEPTTA